MHDATRLDAVDRWARFVRERPTEWKRIHTQFIDAQFEKQRAFLQRLAATPNGKEKICTLYAIKNTAGYPVLLR